MTSVMFFLMIPVIGIDNTIISMVEAGTGQQLDNNNFKLKLAGNFIQRAIFYSSFLRSSINCCNLSRSSLVALLRIKLRAVPRADKYDRCARLSLFHFVDAFFCASLSAMLFSYLNSAINCKTTTIICNEITIFIPRLIFSSFIAFKRNIC